MTRALVASSLNAVTALVALVSARYGPAAGPGILCAGLLPVGLLLTFAWAIQALEVHEPGESEHRQAQIALLLALLPVATIVVVLEALGSGIPWRIWTVADPY